MNPRHENKGEGNMIGADARVKVSIVYYYLDIVSTNAIL